MTNEMATLTSESEIVSVNAPSTIGNNVSTDLKGTQEAKYEIETNTGMLRFSEIESEIKGSIQMQGRQIPVKIKMKVKTGGNRVK